MVHWKCSWDGPSFAGWLAATIKRNIWLVWATNTFSEELLDSRDHVITFVNCTSRVLETLVDSLCISDGGKLNFMKRMLEAYVSSTIRVVLGKHLEKQPECTSYVYNCLPKKCSHSLAKEIIIELSYNLRCFRVTVSLSNREIYRFGQKKHILPVNILYIHYRSGICHVIFIGGLTTGPKAYHHYAVSMKTTNFKKVVQTRRKHINCC